MDGERACEQLDRNKGVEESELWPPILRENPNREETTLATYRLDGEKAAWEKLLERPELDDPEYCASRLVDLLTHLRAVHVYCLHCGCHYDDGADMDRNCP